MLSTQARLLEQQVCLDRLAVATRNGAPLDACACQSSACSRPTASVSRAGLRRAPSTHLFGFSPVRSPRCSCVLSLPEGLFELCSAQGDARDETLTSDALAQRQHVWAARLQHRRAPGQLELRSRGLWTSHVRPQSHWRAQSRRGPLQQWSEQTRSSSESAGATVAWQTTRRPARAGPASLLRHVSSNEGLARDRSGEAEAARALHSHALAACVCQHDPWWLLESIKAGRRDEQEERSVRRARIQARGWPSVLPGTRELASSQRHCAEGRGASWPTAPYPQAHARRRGVMEEKAGETKQVAQGRGG